MHSKRRFVNVFVEVRKNAEDFFNTMLRNLHTRMTVDKIASYILFNLKNEKQIRSIDLSMLGRSIELGIVGVGEVCNVVCCAAMFIKRKWGHHCLVIKFIFLFLSGYVTMLVSFKAMLVS